MSETISIANTETERLPKSMVRVTSLRIERDVRHWHITVFNRGGNAGSLCVDAVDGPSFVEGLMPGYLHRL